MTLPVPPSEEEVFSRAADLPAAERAAYLDQTSRPDGVSP